FLKRAACPLTLKVSYRLVGISFVHQAFRSYIHRETSTMHAILAILAIGLPATLPDGAAPAKVFQVPYRLTNTNHVLVRAKINGKGPYNFILDTGAPALFVSPAISEKLGIEPNKQGWGVLPSFEIEGRVPLKNARARLETPFQLEGMN